MIKTLITVKVSLCKCYYRFETVAVTVLTHTVASIGHFLQLLSFVCLQLTVMSWVSGPDKMY